MIEKTNLADHDLFELQKLSLKDFGQYQSSPYYHVFLWNGNGTVSIDFVEYEVEGKIALFTTPYQHIKIVGNTGSEIERLSFHGDFYCIEYHKKEVACNGLLFNNIYQQPYIDLKDDELHALFEKIRIEKEKKEPYAEPVLRSYLQLILAISSKVKRLAHHQIAEQEITPMEKFRQLLEANFTQERTPLFYANALSISPNTFTKQCTKHYAKPPSQLIQERVILEAKKLLHLTRKSSKEIAALMNFDDEHYFSRYFKKHTGVSPSHFRKEVGISIVADLSMR